MTERELSSQALFHFLNHTHKQVELMLRVFFAVLAGLVRYRKMRKDALRIQSGQRAAVADSRNARLKIISVAQIPQTRHSGIHLDVNL